MTGNKNLLRTSLLITFFVGFFALWFSMSGQQASGDYTKAKVTTTETFSVEQTSESHTGRELYRQQVRYRTQESTEEISVEYGSEFQPLSEDQLLEKNQTVIVQYMPEPVITDVYRLTPWFVLVGIFLLLVFAVARWQGLLSVLGMVATIGILAFLLLPALLQGYDPLTMSIFGATVLAAITLYITHGWNRSTHLAFISVISVLVLVGFLSYGSVLSMHLSGLGSEEALFLQFLSGRDVQLQGLLLGGILLGTLGILDDIIVSQIAVVDELFAAKPEIHFQELFSRSLRVGQSHVASLVNTLVLVYASANLPLFLLFTEHPQPLWVTLNSELIMEELVRTMAGSIGLVLAVPISTFLAAASHLYFKEIFGEPTKQEKKKHAHSHPH